MRAIRKYDVEKREMIDWDVSREWRLALWNTNMDEIVNCAQCGVKLKYGDCYTSRELMNGAGLGYGVCMRCYQEEGLRAERCAS